MFYLFALCLLPILVDEYYLREARAPFAWWVGLATQPLVAEGFLRQYVAIGLISPENPDTVKSFLGMNAYGPILRLHKC
jgi:hypothetical protein